MDTNTTSAPPAPRSTTTDTCFFHRLTGNPRPDCSCGRTTAEESSCPDC